MKKKRSAKASKEPHHRAASRVAYSDIRAVTDQLESTKKRCEVLVIPKEERITSEMIDIFTYTNTVASRAAHLAEGAPAYIDYVALGLTSAEEIAEEEIRQGLCPMDTERHLSNLNIKEVWEVNEMVLPPYL